MPHSNSYIAILDIGHGNCAVLFDHGYSCVIDCGAGSSVLEFLTAEGISKIENVFLSHADLDHIEGLIALLSSDLIKISNVYVNPDGIKKSALWNDITYTLSKRSAEGTTKLHTAITTASGEFKCGELTIETISPTPYLALKSPGSTDQKKRKISSNSVSASFRINWNKKPIAYLAGDIDQISLDSIKDHHIDFEAPLLVFPHHGGHSSGGDIVKFTEELCDATKSQTVIFSIGRNKHNNPLPEVVKTVKSKISKVRIACTQLSKHCASSLNGTSAVHLTPVFAKGRSTDECCGGTFIIELSDRVAYLPTHSSHQSFIAVAAKSPLCL